MRQGHGPAAGEENSPLPAQERDGLRGQADIMFSGRRLEEDPKVSRNNFSPAAHQLPFTRPKMCHQLSRKARLLHFKRGVPRLRCDLGDNTSIRTKTQGVPNRSNSFRLPATTNSEVVKMN